MDTCFHLRAYSRENTGESNVDSALLELVTVGDGVTSTACARRDGSALDHRYLAIFAVVETYAAGRAESWFSCVAIVNAWNVLA